MALLSALMLGLAPEPAPHAAKGITEWFRARARDFEAGERGGSKIAQVWSERPKGLPLPREFVPPTSMAPLIRTVSPGVVNISSSGASPGTVGQGSGSEEEAAGAEGISRSVGSGFILGSEGYVLTNFHVVDSAQQIRVRLADGREFLAEIIGRDASTDLALLRLMGGSLKDLPFVYLGDSDKLEVGDWVLAIGNPYGYDNSVSQGIISAKERVLGIGPFDDFLQTDASMNPGNSGGPLFNMRGEVVGVNTAMVSHAQGIGFAVPINMVKSLLPNLKENGRLARGWLGLTVDDVPMATGSTHKAAAIREVSPGGPAMEAGLHQGDRIIAAQGKPVLSYFQLFRGVSLMAPGSLMRLTVLRGNQRREVSVQVAERPAPETVSVTGYGKFPRLGLTLQDVDSSVASSLHVPPYHGVLVSGLQTDGVGGKAGLRDGDLITEVDHHPVEDIHGFKDMLDRRRPRRKVMLQVERGQGVREIALPPIF